MMIIGLSFCHAAIQNTAFISSKRFNPVTQMSVAESIRNWTVLRERKPVPRPNSQPKVILNLNLDIQINPNLDVCWITPKLLCIIFLASVISSSSVKKNWPVTV